MKQGDSVLKCMLRMPASWPIERRELAMGFLMRGTRYQALETSEICVLAPASDRSGGKRGRKTLSKGAKSGKILFQETGDRKRRRIHSKSHHVPHVARIRLSINMLNLIGTSDVESLSLGEVRQAVATVGTCYKKPEADIGAAKNSCAHQANKLQDIRGSAMLTEDVAGTLFIEEAYNSQLFNDRLD